MKITRNCISCLMTFVLLFSLFNMSVCALSSQEQEDIYRVDTWWQDEYNQQYIDWILDSDNFLYHLDITTGNIIHDISYESLNLDPIERKDNFIKILTAIIDYSYESIREESAQESANELTSYFFDSFEEYMLKQPNVAIETIEIICNATNLASTQFLDYIYLLDTDEMQLSYEKMLEYINRNIAHETLPEGASAYFAAYTTSSDWLEKWNSYSTMFSIVGESISIMTDSFDIAVELESYQKTDKKFVELLKYIQSTTTDSALKAACAEIYTKISNDYEDNFVSEFIERVGGGTVSVTLEVLKGYAADANIYVRCISLGYDAGMLVSNWFFNTEDTQKHMQSIYCLNEVSEVIIPALQNELSNLHYYDSPSEFAAKYAADTIYHMQVVICLRKLGEASYYNLKDSVYSSFVVKALNVLPWLSSKESEQIVEDWYKQFQTVIDSVEGSLYKMIPAYHYYEQPGPFSYTVCNNTVTITEYIGTDTIVTIPSSIDGYPVTTIGVYAFSDCTDLTSVIIPSSITVIGNWAFSNCIGLSDINIPDSVTYIGIFAFNNCKSITDITIGDGVVTIGESAFSNCTNLVSINISRSVANVGNYVFSGCNSLRSIWVDAANLYYSNDDQGVLYNKNKTKLIRAPGALASVTIPHSVTNIGISAFSYSNVLNNVSIPNSVTSIEEYAFYSCSSLPNIAIPASVTNIGSYVFSKCTGLNHVAYTGTESQWQTISIGSDNSYLTEATKLHYETQIEYIDNCEETGIYCPTCQTMLSCTKKEGGEHQYSEWTTTILPGLSTVGERERYCIVCNKRTAEMLEAYSGTIKKWNITLTDDWKVNFYLEISEEIIPTASVVATIGDSNLSVAAAELTKNENGYYCITFGVSAAQMNDIITIQVINGEDCGEVFTDTVRQYCDTILADEKHSQYHALVKEMLNYGAMAQVYFSYDAGNLANKDITGVATKEIPETADELTVGDEISGLSFHGASLVYRDKIAVRYYFTGDVTGCTFTDAQGNRYTPVPKDGMQYVEIADILPQNLDQQITLTVTDAEGNQLFVTYGPMNYIVRMNAKGGENLKNLLKALYNYHLAAKALSTAA